MAMSLYDISTEERLASDLNDNSPSCTCASAVIKVVAWQETGGGWVIGGKGRR
jgi:hypothetical protein